MHYAKVFDSILDSTVWGLSKEARLLWIVFLVKRDREQIVRASVPGLAHAARITLPECEKALKELMRSDPHSQSKEHEGRRVLKVEGGWFVVNGAKYRDMMSKEERRAYQAAWQKEYRKRKKDNIEAGAVRGAQQAVSEWAEKEGVGKASETDVNDD